jgi:hypothetical protein
VRSSYKREIDYRVVASYRTCCFCDKPEFQPGPLFHANGKPVPRRRLIEEYARTIGGTVEYYSPLSYGSGASATVTLPIACSHRKDQSIRLEVVPQTNPFPAHTDGLGNLHWKDGEAQS